MDRSLLGDFRLDWKLAGKAEQTVTNYIQHLNELLDRCPEPTLSDVKSWLTQVDTPVARRKRGQAVRAFGKWAEECEYDAFRWWKQIPLAKEPQRPQETATEADYRKALAVASSPRDKALIEVLWSCGLRRSEIAKLNAEDVNLADGYLIVRQSKTGKPRVVPLSPSARHALRRYMRGVPGGTVFGMTSNAIRLCLQRLEGTLSSRMATRLGCPSTQERGIGGVGKGSCGMVEWCDGLSIYECAFERTRNR